MENVLKALRYMVKGTYREGTLRNFEFYQRDLVKAGVHLSSLRSAFIATEEWGKLKHVDRALTLLWEAM